jgi:hypothetical protein
LRHKEMHYVETQNLGINGKMGLHKPALRVQEEVIWHFRQICQ